MKQNTYAGLHEAALGTNSLMLAQSFIATLLITFVLGIETLLQRFLSEYG